MHFMWHTCAPNRGHNMQTKFVDNRSNVKQIEMLLRKSRWRRPPCWIWVTRPFDSVCVFCFKVAISILNLALISQIVKQWQTFFEIEDGGVSRFEFWQLCIYNVIDVFLIEVPMFPLILVTIGQILKKLKQLFENQDGGGHHLELWLLRFFNVTDVF